MRTVAESTALIDRIVGRCVRDAAFAEQLLLDPEHALAEYRLTEGELEDFRALRATHAREARAQWAILRSILYRRCDDATPAPGSLLIGRSDGRST
jgi:hypothetical protein